MNEKLMNLYFGLSATCNLRCTYCYVPEYNKNQKRKQNDEAIQITDELIKRFKKQDYKLNQCVLHGAESFVLEPETINIIVNKISPLTFNKYCKVQTNGTLLTEDYHQRMGNLSDKFFIGFSIDAKDVHNKYRNNSYDLVMKNLRLTRSKGYKMQVLSVIGDETVNHLDQLEELIQVCEELGIIFVMKYLHTKDGSYMINKQDQRDKWSRWLYETGNYKYLQNFSSSFCCNIGSDCGKTRWYEFNANGSVVTCNKTNSNELSFANWKIDDFKDIEQKRISFFNNQKENNDCKDCMYYGMCRGGCPVDRLDDNYAIDCDIKKYIFNRMIKDGINPSDNYFNNIIGKNNA
jgi:uncharacterized protein